MKLTDSLNIIKALGDSSRLLIINSLKEKPQYVEELSKRLNLAVSTISFHLKKLEAAGLINKVKDQYYVVYHLNKNIFNYSLDTLTSFHNADKPFQDERILKYKEKVVKTFTSRGRIKKLPAQHKKRILLFEQLLQNFKMGVPYPESKVNDIISEVYDDYCTIRRSFIDEKMMIRKEGIYTLNQKYVPQFPFTPGKAVPKIKSLIKMDKSEIKKAYKQTETPMGVYKIINTTTGNVFAGSARNLKALMNRHRFELSTKTHAINELQEEWNKAGEKNLKFEIIDKLEPKNEPGYKYSDDLQELENLWIEKLLSEGVKVIRLKNTKLA